MDISNLGKISKMLDEDKFWEIIDQSLKIHQIRINKKHF